MATYLVLGHFTEQGMHKVKDTTKRAEAVREIARKCGATVKDLYWTLGQYDVALVLEAPDETSATAFGLSVGVLGNVRTQTLRAFTPEEMTRLLGRMA